MKKIVLVGYMGSGKTEIGKLLAKKILFPFYDLDFLIENEVQKSISELFSEKGEIYFRRIEHELFVKQIQKNESYVLSLGGGTPCYANNHLILQQEEVISIYLKASVSNLVERLSINKKKRPLVKDLDATEMHEFIAKHLFDRGFYYNQCKHVISVDDKSPTDVVEEIKKMLL
ncbi:shikimate kinase [Flavobacterium amnicola]|uniref:Shikimate kinase n=1 Tax=Flavobacterium amnicola TaxID=2506422 RepID=A0A4Q1K253_9FLAO|nr:shikimate kinase [Flavobacterium amnicola]RXR17698.1 shikimate kinase [Flavobacterium amnicola]